MKSICLVGNGTSLLGGGRGEFIDSHGDVLRFLVKPGRIKVEMTPEDYGRRLDIWAASAITIKHVREEPRSCRELWIFNKFAATRKPRRDEDKLRRRMPLYPCEIKQDDDSIKHWLHVYKELRRPNKLKHFSRGTAAVIMAAASGRYDPIMLLGFDAVTGAEDGFYSTVCLEGTLGIPMFDGQEDFQAEGRMLPMIAKEYGVTIQW
jgi:hypothetical protein